MTNPKAQLNQQLHKPLTRAGKHRALISLPSATLEGYQLSSGIYVAPDLQRRIEEKAAVIGTVVAADPSLGIYPGEKVAVDYRVVSDVEREKGENMSPRHLRAWIIGDQLVWEARHNYGEGEHGRVFEIIAVQREGKWHSLGHYAMLKKVERSVMPEGDHLRADDGHSRAPEGTLLIPMFLAKEEVEGQGTIACAGCTDKDGHTYQVGDRVAFRPQVGSIYQFDDGEEYLVIPVQFIDGF